LYKQSAGQGAVGVMKGTQTKS